MEKLLLTAEEVAQALGIGRTKVFELLAHNTLPRVRIGRSVRIPADAVRSWVASQPGTEDSDAYTCTETRDERVSTTRKPCTRKPAGE
ncbi:MAG: helix-turn-helix transcriptional regulator [Chloroflexota bacterium]|nr:MAG: transcriptional regulator [Chloroflexota bacterium]